jgi:hypothetical protein
MKDVNTLLATLMAALVAFVHPIQDFMLAAVMLFTLNYIFGLTADISSGGGWSFHKSMVFFYHSFLFFGLAFFVFAIGHFLHNDAGAVQCVSFLCYAAVYFFGTNIFRNMLLILSPCSPMHRLVAFIYYIFSLQFTERLPFLQNYLNKNKKN